MRKLAQVFILILMATPNFELTAQDASPQNSYFSGATVYAILNQRGVTRIRMYPVSSQINTVVITGVNSKGQEVPAAGYHIFQGISGSKVSTASINAETARAYFKNYMARNRAFVSELSRNAALELLGSNARGLFIQYKASDKPNFAIRPYTGEGTLEVQQMLKYGDPCPPACGAAQNYLIAPF